MLWRSWRSQQISTLRGHFQSKNLYCRLRGFKAGFLVKGRFGIFLKIHPIWYHHPPQGPSYHTVKIFNIFWTFPLKAFVLKRIEYHSSNLEYMLTYFVLFIYLSSTFQIFFITFQILSDLKYFFLYFSGPAFVSVVTLELRVAIRIEFFTRWACKCEMQKCKCAITN